MTSLANAIPYTLSFFQTATQQLTKIDYGKMPGLRTAGGGFGPVRYRLLRYPSLNSTAFACL